jgi:polyketide cyclase/dehydrase/lipid transport protein
MTVRVAESVQIDKPPAEVWEAIADYSLDLKWRKGLTEMKPDPPGAPAVGTKVHEVVHQARRIYVADTVVTDLDPGVSYQFMGSGTIDGLRGVRAVRSGGDRGAVFTYEIELEPRGAMRMLRPALERIVRSGLKGDLERLKALLEAQP